MNGNILLLSSLEENVFYLVLSGELLYPSQWRGNYVSPDNTIGKLFPKEKTIICLFHSISF